MNAEIDFVSLSIAAQRGRQEMNERDSIKAFALWGAGWTAETPHATQQDIMSYYWRRPSMRKGRKGRLFLSTDQAYHAMMKGTATTNTDKS